MENVFKKLAAEVIAENSEFGYTASAMDVANDVWYRLTVDQRNYIMKEVDYNSLTGSIMTKLRICVRYIKDHI